MLREAVADGGEERVMSAPVRNDDNPSMFPTMYAPTMYAPPWAREEARDVPRDAGMAAVDKALNASKLPRFAVCASSLPATVVRVPSDAPV